MNKCPSQLTAIAALCVALSGCGITFVEEKVAKRIEPASTPLITALNVKPIDVKRAQLQPEALEVIRDGYAELADKIEDDELTRQLNLRLADVEMLLAEEQQVEGTGADTDEEAYQRAINAYKKVLTNYPGDVSEAEVLYQLSRAYDLQGKGFDLFKLFIEKGISYTDKFGPRKISVLDYLNDQKNTKWLDYIKEYEKSS